MPNPAQYGQDGSGADGEATPPVVSVEAPGDAGPNYGSNPRGDSRPDSGPSNSNYRMSVASQAGPGDATLGQCAIKQCQKLDATRVLSDSEIRSFAPNSE